MITKTDFKIASTCPKKLVYKNLGYPTANDESEFIKTLAQGGYVANKLAQLYYPTGTEINDSNIDDAVRNTLQYLNGDDDFVLFEAAIKSGDKLVRIDILERKNGVMNLIEVKSKLYDSSDHEKTIKKLEEEIDDLAFQTFVFKEAYPEAVVKSYLLLPNKSKRTNIEGLAGWFIIITPDDEELVQIEELPARQTANYLKPVVKFIYDDDPNRQEFVNQIINDGLLELVELSQQVETRKESVQDRSEHFLRIIRNEITQNDYAIGKVCSKCEFNLGAEIIQNGRRECMGELHDARPHIFDLYYGGSIENDGQYYFDELLANNKASFSDLDEERFKTKKGDLGPRGTRQLLQKRHTLADTEFLGVKIKNELEALQYPLYFIDFEGYTGAVPFFRGMRPYEKIAFQWSCHKIESENSEPSHEEWINSEYAFPNFAFAESLMAHIGDNGTPLMWSHYENTTLREILKQMQDHGYENNDLKSWLERITDDKVTKRKGRFVDMNKLTLKHYFHPLMKGKTSIKKVLPAVLHDQTFRQSTSWINETFVNNTSLSVNPYDQLSRLANEFEAEEAVDEGTDAMKAYYEIMYGSLKDDRQRRNEVIESLKKYCKLDTLAMVIIWKYWMYKSIS